jgi:mannose-1-phosphate guanylyltransferase
MPHRYVLVLAGGRGERFWPWSRPERPKQLLPLAGGGRSLLANTMVRATAVAPAERCLVITSADLVARVAAECPPGTRIVGERTGRNTAPAIGAAAAWIERQDPGSSFAVMPADHAIDHRDAFAADLDRAMTLAEREPVLITFGVRPTRAEAGFGWLRPGDRLAERLHRVAAFVEKPAVERARALYAEGTCLWNAGIFAWRAGVFLEALAATRPPLARALAPLAEEPDLQQGLDRVLASCESISVDYAVLEHAPNVVMLEASFDWDDLGSWTAWARRQPQDAAGNVLFGEAVAVDCERCVVVGDGGPAAALGLRDMVVVHAGGATLACPLDRGEDVRRVTEALRARSTSA